MSKESMKEFWRKDWTEFKRTVFDFRRVSISFLCIIVLVLVCRTYRHFQTVEEAERQMQPASQTK
jgi:hypothetical protein